ncbi:MAG TPA: 4-(cytidine 5'-diphospho)-2-C-methyl-D-erythritol kinase [Thermoanaerobaculia bacterium]|nr:4-(cytidine 5'-diphospho)-2-C-methyl-D-erythritol kinase [Thermoanaerobaculia bacterium]
MILRAEAFAKTNLRLEVLGRRRDGFHEIDTVFQTIDLTDRLEVSEAPGRIDLECTDPSVPSDSRNLVVRAADALRRRFPDAGGARIRLEKNIPAGGGLGGGSSDAAIALLLLARLWKLPVGPAELAGIGAELGSDVPFFFVGGTARGRGRGEIVEPLPDAPSRALVLVVPPFSISTAEVYSRWRPGDAPDPAGPVFGPNSLASAVLAINPEMDRHRRAISRSYPDCQVSGSGSCLVAWEGERNAETAKALASELPGARVLRTRTVSRSEYEKRSTLELSLRR